MSTSEDRVKNKAIEQFAATAQGLLDRIRVISRDADAELDRLGRATRNHRRWLLVVLIGGALDIALTVAVTLGAVQMGHTQQRLRDVQDTQGSQVLCPLYVQFINSDTPAAQKFAQQSGQDMQLRKTAFAVIRHGYTVLGCQPALGKDGFPGR